jgi:hypothetical protein
MYSCRILYLPPPTPQSPPMRILMTLDPPNQANEPARYPIDVLVRILMTLDPPNQAKEPAGDPTDVLVRLRTAGTH